MTERKWTLKIVDAKSRIRAWSKQKTLYAILVAGLAATMLAPTVALADDAMPAAPATEAIEMTVPAAEPADKQVVAPTETTVATPAETTSAVETQAAETPATETPATTTETTVPTPSEPASSEQPAAPAAGDSAASSTSD